MFDFGNVGASIAAFEKRFSTMEALLNQIVTLVSPPAAAVLVVAEKAVDTIATASQAPAPIVDHSTADTAVAAAPTLSPAPISDAVTQVVSAATDLAALAKTLGL